MTDYKISDILNLLLYLIMFLCMIFASLHMKGGTCT